MNAYVKNALETLDSLSDGAQTFFEELGKNGCYLFCLARLANFKSVCGFVSAILAGIEKGWILYGGRGDADNFTVQDPCAFLGLLTNRKWTVRKVGADYAAKEGEKEVQVWHSAINGATHFRLADYDPIEASVTVRTGRIESIRIFKEV